MFRNNLLNYVKITSSQKKNLIFKIMTWPLQPLDLSSVEVICDKLCWRDTVRFFIARRMLRKVCHLFFFPKLFERMKRISKAVIKAVGSIFLYDNVLYS